MFSIMLTGFSRHSFNLLSVILFADPITQVFGRQRLLDYKDELGLYQFNVNSTMTRTNLCIIFGITQTQCSSIVSKMTKLVYVVLRSHVVDRVNFQKKLAPNIKRTIL